MGDWLLVEGDCSMGGRKGRRMEGERKRETRPQTSREGGGDDENEDELPRRQVTCRMRSMKTAEERRAQEGQDGEVRPAKTKEKGLLNCRIAELSWPS